LLAFLLLFDSITSQLIGFLLASVICLLIAYVGKVGAGDVKLFLVLVATSGSLVLTLEYFLGMALISLCVLVTSFLSTGLKGHLSPRSIAFAPSILIPFLLLYLAI
jgi:Flp pilus assembly protein protease CpaA